MRTSRCGRLPQARWGSDHAIVVSVPESYHQVVGRYALFDEIASGGMASVHIGRLLGPVGFSRTVAIKRLHPQFAKDPDFVDMFVDEARLAARIRHPNVVPTLDVVKTEQELFLVMDYVEGESLSRLMRRARRREKPLDVRLVVPVVAAVLHGLHAAHNAKGEGGELLHIVHRDVSPQNVLVGTDGVTRVFDFGIAKARGRLQTTREGQIKGKLAYMAPEQLSGGEVGPQTDIYAAAVVLWEALANRRLFDADNEALLLAMVLEGVRYAPSAFNPAVSAELDAIVMRALNRDAGLRFHDARELARTLERTAACASLSEIGEWVEELATDALGRRAHRIAEIESQSDRKSFAHGLPLGPEAGGARHSQLSSISVAGVPVREKNSLGRSVAVAAVALMVGGGAAVFMMQRPVAPPVTAGQGSAVAAPSAAPSGQTELPAATGRAVAVPSSSGASDPHALPSSSAPPPPVRSAARRRKSPRTPPSPRSRTPLPPSPEPAAQPKCALEKVFLPDGSFTYKNVCK